MTLYVITLYKDALRQTFFVKWKKKMKKNCQIFDALRRTLYVEYRPSTSKSVCHLRQTYFVLLNRSTSNFDVLQNVAYKMLPTWKIELQPTKYILRALYEERSTKNIFPLYNKCKCPLRRMPTLYNKTLYEVHSTKLRPTNKKPPTDDLYDWRFKIII